MRKIVTRMLVELAELNEPVDTFFVVVIVDDKIAIADVSHAGKTARTFLRCG